MIDRDYGFDFRSPGALRLWDAVTDGSTSRIESAGHYVGACIRLARRGSIDGVTVEYERVAVDGAPVDGRLVAVGWNHESPRAWLAGGLQRFLGYYNRATQRPSTPGSPYNAAPEAVYAAMRSSIPAWQVRAGDWSCERVRHVPQRERTRIRRAARASIRTSVFRWDGQPCGVSPGALEQLGRLSPELQRALLHVSGYRAETHGRDGDQVLRCRDLRWDLVAPIHRALAADPTGRVRAAWATGKRQQSLAVDAGCPRTAIWSAGDVVPVDLAAWLAPSYPRIPMPLAARLCRGETPAQLSDGELTRAEAHRWCSEGASVTPTEWLQRGLPTEVPPLRDIAVVRWLLDVQRRGSWGQLTRERTAHGPAGAEALFRFLDRIDEIMVEDLPRGHRTRVEDAFRSAAERMGGAWLDQHRDDHRVLAPATGWPLFRRSMRELRTPAALVAEGKALEHCVGGYVGAVEDRRVVFLGLQVGAERSTVEMTRDGRVLQHRGPRNATPAPVLERLLDRFMARSGLGGTR